MDIKDQFRREMERKYGKQQKAPTIYVNEKRVLGFSGKVSSKLNSNNSTMQLELGSDGSVANESSIAQPIDAASGDRRTITIKHESAHKNEKKEAQFLHIERYLHRIAQLFV